MAISEDACGFKDAILGVVFRRNVALNAIQTRKPIIAAFEMRSSG